MSHEATQTTFGAADRPPIELPHPVRMRVLGAVMVGVFLGALDQTVVGTALPRIITDLGGNGLYTWAFTAYLLTATISGPLYGKLSDLFGRRPILLFAVSLFLVASLLCALSQEMWQFVFFRALQGLGGGAFFPVAIAVMADLYTPAERGKYQGLFGAVFGIAFVVGPLIGGFLTENFGWHWIFYVNIPIGIIALIVIARLLPNVRTAGARPTIDYFGTVTIVAGLVPISV